MPDFYREMREFVLQHGAIHNGYLSRFHAGDVTDRDLNDFAIEFYHFARFFPKILVAQLVNTEDERVADELTRLLYSELGDGNPRHRHELLYRNFLRSLGISVHEALTRPLMPSTRAYIDGMESLYASGDHDEALGASFGLENMATTMWDQLIPGLKRLQRDRHPEMDITYFTFHRELESSHEDAMAHAIEVMALPQSVGQRASAERRDRFRHGVRAVLDYLEGFWLGLECQRSAVLSEKVSAQSNEWEKQGEFV